MARQKHAGAQPDWRRFPIGVELSPAGTPHARVWAPARRRVDVIVENPDGSPAAEIALERDSGGYFAGELTGVSAGARYRFRLDGARTFPDPASRFQPDGPHGPSEIIDPHAFSWSDADWPGVSRRRQVIYELHVGTFTRGGTFRDAIEQLPDLVDLGVTTIEIMPIAEFVGRFGWGYDGVDLFAPYHVYGTPDDLRALVDAAHRLQLGAILDVVYNHFGPDGNYLKEFAPHYFSGKNTEWGEAINFDGDDSRPVRELFIANAAYWIDEFHFDGLRLDATQQIFDESSPHILTEVAAAVRAAAGVRSTFVVAENEPQHAKLVRDVDGGGCGLDALWNDDFHHAARVALTGRNEAYYSGYRGSAQELISAAKYGFLYQGEWYGWQKQRRGTPALDLPFDRFVNFLQNHDQVANTAGGERLHAVTSPGRLRAATALLLLLPQTPMLFQGQEFAASSRFVYFADHNAELATLVRAGRTEFMSQFESIGTVEGAAALHDPGDAMSFARCKLDWSERARNTKVVALHRDLIRLRHDDAVIGAPDVRVDGARLGEYAFVLRFFGDDAGDRLLLVNLGARLHLESPAEPLLAPPADSRWSTLLSTEVPAYGGWGTPDVETRDDGWWLPPESAVLLEPVRP